jgi:hypothetical protein
MFFPSMTMKLIIVLGAPSQAEQLTGRVISSLPASV